MSHTPGPWKAINDETFVATGPMERIVPVASVYGEEGGSKIDETMKANARLIAAAPDLLDVCEFILRCIQTPDANPLIRMTDQTVAEMKLTKAVAKAKGA